jgi:hypothetical protein
MDTNLIESVQAKKELDDRVNKASKFEKMSRPFMEKYQRHKEVVSHRQPALLQAE